jgi:mono/diheme cytochrome c family protein
MGRRSQSVLAFLCLMTLAFVSACKPRTGGPGKFESEVAREVKRKITVGGKDWKNPIEDSEDNAQIGEEHFQHHCMICHGLDGHNTGVPFASKMDPPIPDLAAKDVQEYTDGQLKWIIQNGIAPSGMPSWQGILSDDEMWHIVTFIRHLPPAGSLGIPAVYQESEAEHQATEQKAPPKSKKKTRHIHHHHH